MTTHQPEEAERCHRIAILDGGRVAATGTPDELRAHVAGDVVRVRGERPDELRATITARLSLAGRVVDGDVVVEAPRGHELVPRIAELFPPGRIVGHRHQPADAGRRVRQADRQGIVVVIGPSPRSRGATCAASSGSRAASSAPPRSR